MVTTIRALFSSLFITGFVLFSLTSCDHPYGAALTKAGRAELLEMHRSGEVNLDQAAILKPDGKKVDMDDVQRLKEGVLAGDYYLDAEGVIRKVIVRPANYQDRITAILIANIGYDPREGIEILKLDCDSLKNAMSDYYRAKPPQYGIQESDTLSFWDFERIKIVSLVENCGFPSAQTFGREGVRIFWLMVQHSWPEVIAGYYSDFERAVENGDLKESTFVLMTDRLLMHFDYPQVYGSQILNGELYTIENPDSVDIRRASVGLGPLEEYLKNFDLN